MSRTVSEVKTCDTRATRKTAGRRGLLKKAFQNYEVSDTPWDKGAPAPALVNFLRQQPISGRVLVPGCGRGHEVREIGRQPQTSVVGMDISTAAIAQAKKLEDPSDASAEISFVEGDFFKLPANLNKSFDWLVEHTCFCAIEPQRRLDYVVAASSALRTGGKIFGIFYINPDVEHGPPFAVSKEELSKLFDPHFTLLDEWVPKESFPDRENGNWFGLCKSDRWLMCFTSESPK